MFRPRAWETQWASTWIAWGIFTVYMWIASFRVSVAVNVAFALLAITFFLLGIGDVAAHSDITKVGGWFGLAHRGCRLGHHSPG